VLVLGTRAGRQNLRFYLGLPMFRDLGLLPNIRRHKCGDKSRRAHRGWPDHWRDDHSGLAVVRRGRACGPCGVHGAHPSRCLQLGRLRGFARRAGAPRMTAPVRRDIRGTWSALHLSDARVLACGVNPLRSAAVLDFADADRAAVHPHRRSSGCSGPVVGGTYATRCGRPGFRVPCRATSSARAAPCACLRAVLSPATLHRIAHLQEQHTGRHAL
jgi:hypothetical protein